MLLNKGEERVMVMRYFFIMSLCVLAFSLDGKKKTVDADMIMLDDSAIISVIDGFESLNSFICYVNIDNVRYLLKQKKTPSKQFSVVRDALAAYIAKDLKIAQSVQIIPAKKEFAGKRNKHWPATLHSIAAGKMIWSQPESKYYRLSLKQRGRRVLNQWLTETIIHQITWHKQLPIIIGLDLFLCNTDRHRGNLFYDPTTDCFCAIDMDNIFRRDLPSFAYEKLLLMIGRHKQFTKEEVEALKKVRETLRFLLERYSVNHIINKLHFFVKQAGFVPGSRLYTEKIVKKIARHEKTIKESRVSLYKLLSLLDTIIDEY
jgi:hypothetical protein